MAKNNLNFHQTFPPTADGLSRLGSVDRGGNRNPMGKSGGKVEPYLAYAEYMGLLNKPRRLIAWTRSPKRNSRRFWRTASLRKAKPRA